MSSPPTPSYTTSLLGGALAGTTTDLILYPLDTLKTRLQSPSGFVAAGGLSGIYRGIGPVILAGAPSAAIFFYAYETSKAGFARRLGSEAAAVSDAMLADGGGTRAVAAASPWKAYVSHMAAGAVAEIASCGVRVPAEVVKQRAQAGQQGGRSVAVLRALMASAAAVEGTVTPQQPSVASRFRRVWIELYRGWGITVLREVPFTMLQFPLWEVMKTWGRERAARTGRGLFGHVKGENGKSHDVGAIESALYGSLSATVAAGLTTPLDMLKTRVMLSARQESVLVVARRILRKEGARALFAGIGPRVIALSTGGAIFLGSYQWAVNLLSA